VSNEPRDVDCVSYSSYCISVRRRLIGATGTKKKQIGLHSATRTTKKQIGLIGATRTTKKQVGLIGATGTTKKQIGLHGSCSVALTFWFGF
jgi:hypothetical protein